MGDFGGVFEVAMDWCFLSDGFGSMVWNGGTVSLPLAVISSCPGNILGEKKGAPQSLWIEQMFPGQWTLVSYCFVGTMATTPFCIGMITLMCKWEMETTNKVIQLRSSMGIQWPKYGHQSKRSIWSTEPRLGDRGLIILNKPVIWRNFTWISIVVRWLRVYFAAFHFTYCVLSYYIFANVIDCTSFLSFIVFAILPPILMLV